MDETAVAWRLVARAERNPAEEIVNHWSQPPHSFSFNDKSDCKKYYQQHKKAQPLKLNEARAKAMIEDRFSTDRSVANRHAYEIWLDKTHRSLSGPLFPHDANNNLAEIEIDKVHKNDNRIQRQPRLSQQFGNNNNKRFKNNWQPSLSSGRNTKVWLSALRRLACREKPKKREIKNRNPRKPLSWYDITTGNDLYFRQYPVTGNTDSHFAKMMSAIFSSLVPQKASFYDRTFKHCSLHEASI